MAEEVNVPAGIKQRFSEFSRIESLTRDLQSRIDQINNDNKAAAGSTDATAKTYHTQIDQPTSDLSGLVGDLATLFGVTGDNGKAAADTLDKGEQVATEQANGWTPKGAK